MFWRRNKLNRDLRAKLAALRGEALADLLQSGFQLAIVGQTTPHTSDLSLREADLTRDGFPSRGKTDAARRGGALVDAVILQPKLGGLGFDLKKFFSSFKK
jgi:hypothetical protein